jgi:catechol 2,3-dioxygenase-like lactoylglutathione lyase family enzyme
VPDLKIGWLTVDAKDPHTIGAFWKEALGFDVVHKDDDGDEFAIGGRGRAGTRWSILFYKAAGEKTTKNRLHFDLIPDTDKDAEVARLEGLGATRTDIGQGDVTWVVMADPEGNEFCVLSPRTDIPE